MRNGSKGSSSLWNSFLNIKSQGLKINQSDTVDFSFYHLSQFGFLLLFFLLFLDLCSSGFLKRSRQDTSFKVFLSQVIFFIELERSSN